MEEQKISFQVAKLAKECGYPQENYPCFGDDGVIHSVMYFLASFPDYNKYYQTTQSLLQKWLREEHGIEVLENRPNNFDGEVFWSYEIFINGFAKNRERPEIEWKTYEEALEEGLLNGLKLIK